MCEEGRALNVKSKNSVAKSIALLWKKNIENSKSFDIIIFVITQD